MVMLTDSGEEKKKIKRMLLESSWFYVVHGHKIQLVLYSVVSGLWPANVPKNIGCETILNQDIRSLRQIRDIQVLNQNVGRHKLSLLSYETVCSIVLKQLLALQFCQFSANMSCANVDNFYV